MYSKRFRNTQRKNLQDSGPASHRFGDASHQRRFLQSSEINWKLCAAIDVGNIRFESTINGESVSFGVMAIATMRRLSIITRSGEMM